MQAAEGSSGPNDWVATLGSEAGSIGSLRLGLGSGLEVCLPGASGRGASQRELLGVRMKCCVLRCPEEMQKAEKQMEATLFLESLCKSSPQAFYNPMNPEQPE